MKKFLIGVLLAISCLCFGLFVACQTENKDDDDNGDVTETECTLTFLKTEHVSYNCELLSDEAQEEGSVKVKPGTSVAFTLTVEEGYEKPVVRAGENRVMPEEEVYSVLVSSDTVIRVTVSETTPDNRLLNGGGTSSSPFLVTSVRDLDVMAERVNSGNASYVMGYYRLENDIDCGGALLEVTGKFDTPSAFFAGVFDGNGKTISNFEIESSGKYVGLFGCVQASSGSDVSGIIQNLTLKDYTVTAHLTSATENDDTINSYVGSFIGFGAGAHLAVCTTENGSVVYDGDPAMPVSYVGGAIGVLQSISLNSQGYLNHYLASANYVGCDTDVDATGVFAAGGVVGYVVSSHERAAVTVVNSYSTGYVMGAMRAGGVVGILDNYSSVANCYSTGEVSASSNFSSTTQSENLYAYAGGVVSYAGTDTIISNSFTVSDVYVSSSLSGEAVGQIVAGRAEPTAVNSVGLTILNCRFGEDVQRTGIFFKSVMNWSDVDWVFVDGSYPTINLDPVDSHELNVTLNYSHTVNGKTSEIKTISLGNDSYVPFNYFFANELSEIIAGDNGFTSYGYYFDADFRERVPFGYVITGDTTLYVGFADYNEVAGNYYNVKANGAVVTLTLNADGTYEYSDGFKYSSTYTYDGEALIFGDALFARLTDQIVSDSSGNLRPELNFEAYAFKARLTEQGLEAYDGTYFTDDDTLSFTKNLPSTENAFVGTWVQSATINKTYVFNSDNTWSYSFKGVTNSGTYSVDGGVANLGNGVTASFDNRSGLLSINGELFSLEGSYYGVWQSADGDYLILDGYNKDLAGNAVAVLDDETYELTYVSDNFFGTGTYVLLNNYSLFGYFSVNANGTVTAYVYNSYTYDFTDYTFNLVDDYLGVWVGEGAAFTILDFNGFGLYSAEQGSAQSGYVVINGERVPYSVDADDGLNGTFAYGGVTYSLSYDAENGVITVSSGETTVNMERRDEMYSTPLISRTSENNVYEFDGRGKLPKGGTMTRTDRSGNVTEYGYKIVSGSVEDKNLNISVLDGYNGAEIGTIVIDRAKNCFVVTINGTSEELLLNTRFTGTWAAAGMMRSFTLNKFDLSYTTTGRFWDMESTTYTYYPEYDYVRLSYINDNLTTYVDMYLILLEGDNLAISSYDHLVANDFIYAAKRDEMGRANAWTNALNSNYYIQFDGLADSMYTLGTAYDYLNEITYNYTRRYGKLYMWDAADESKAFVLESCSINEKAENVFSDGARQAYKFVDFDVVNTPLITVEDGEGTEYSFYLSGKVTFGSEEATCLLVSADTEKTVVLMTLSNGTERTATVNHSDKTITFAD